MKKLIFFLSILLCSATLASAVPADPRPATLRQADGSLVQVLLHGDESFHWMTTLDGTEVEWNSAGQLTKVPEHRRIARMASSVSPTRKVRRAPSPQKSISLGNKRFLVLLIEFSDIHFTKTKSNFYNLINEQNYNSTGSVADYFKFQSGGKFNPTWDVVGPIRVSGTMATYGKNDSEGMDLNPDGLLSEACSLIDTEVDFSRYDNDGDGVVDNVFFFFAGSPESSPGVTSNAIWPHSWELNYPNKYNVNFDGVRVYSYACASELMDSYGSSMAEIGTFCHEFGHVLGLPDFYDVDYEENERSIYDPGPFSLMSRGCYNNDELTPPNLSAMERTMLGWMSEPTEITASGTYTLEPIYNNQAYITKTFNEGEYFLYELRNGQNYDAYIMEDYDIYPATGIVVYHVDKSLNSVGGTTAADIWEEAYYINAYGSHPCYRVIPAKIGSNLSEWPYPGTSKCTSFFPTEWSGRATAASITNISYAGTSASFRVDIANTRILRGKVCDSMGAELGGATVRVEGEGLSYETETDGSYRIEIPQSAPNNLRVTASLNGYLSSSKDVTIGQAPVTVNFTLYSVEDGGPVLLQKYQGEDYETMGYGDPTDYPNVTVGVRFTAQELGDFVNATLNSISFMVYGNSAAEAKVFVDFGNTRVVEKVVDNLGFYPVTNTIDISEWNAIIPQGTDIYFGYALKSADHGYPVIVDGSDIPIPGGGLVSSNYNAKGYNLTEFDANVVVSARVIRQTISPLTAAGIKVIYYDEPTSSYKLSKAGEEPTSIDWKFEGNKVTATLQYSNGNIEIIEREF